MRIVPAISVSIIVMPACKLREFVCSSILLMLILIGTNQSKLEPFQNQRLILPAGVIEIAAHPPEPPMRLSLKYLINPSHAGSTSGGVLDKIHHRIWYRRVVDAARCLGLVL